MARTTPLRLNRHLFTATGTDSGSLNVLGTLVHRFPDEGDYVIEVSKDGRRVGRKLLVVSDEYHSVQATIDLATVGAADRGGCDCDPDPCTCEAQSYTCIREEGYVVFHVSSGSGGYAVTVDPIEHRDVREFDGTELGEDDVFAAVLLRPGEYAMRNTLTSDEGRLTVVYPDPERTREAVREPIELEVTDRGFDRASVEVHPGQGLVFRIAEPARIEIELLEPHEKSSEEPGPAGPVRVTHPPARPGAGVGRVRGRIDPADLEPEAVDEAVKDIGDRRELTAILLAEKRSADRPEATAAIERRLRELGP